ncbi:MAG: putative histidine kinase, unorthodox [Ramlibacter sp.]|nr:putative histidine kinase, unorthodox [Ramlibacter sp.]
MNNESFFAQSRLPTLLGALVALAVGIAVLLGWMLDLALLKSLLPGAVHMKANAALGFLVTGVVLLLHCAPRGREWPRLALALSLALAVLAGATLLQYLSGHDFGIDELLFRDRALVHNTIPGRMSPFTAWALLMLAACLAVRGVRGWGWLGLLCTAQVALIGAVAVVGYALDARELVTEAWMPAVAPNTALAFTVLGGCLLAGGFRAAPHPGDEYRDFSGVERRLVVALWSMVVVLVLSSAYAYRTNMGYVRAAHLVAQTQEVRLGLARLDGCIDRLEAVQRHYMLVGDLSYRAQYKSGLASCADGVHKIVGLVADNPAQGLRAAKLHALVFDRLQAFEEITDILEFQGFQKARETLVNWRGPRLTREIERMVAEMDEAERGLLTVREMAEEQGRTTMLVSLLVTLALAVLIFAGLIRATRKALRRSVAARAQSRQRQALLSALINSIPDVISYKDRNGVYLGCNEAYAAMLGVTATEVIGRTAHEVFPREQAEAIWEQDQRVLGGMEERSFEEWFTYPDGHRELMHLKRNLLRGEDGRVTGMLAIGRDITERKKAEEEIRQAKELAEGATRMKSDFLANMSHEIRTPMTGVLGMLDVLAADKLTPVQQRYVERIRASGRHLLNVINDILDFSKLETGKLELERIDFSMPELFDRLEPMTRHLAVERGLHLAFELEPDVPAVVRGDPTRLTQVLLNLVSNGLKFTDRGSVTVRTSQVRGDDAPGMRLRFEVSDTGMGIEAGTLSQLFAPFVQADSSTARRYGGSGLGLAICKRLVEAMGGSIGATSEPGAGSRFFFDLPLELGEARAVVRRGAAAAAPPQPRRILVAEDVEMNRDILQAMLGKQGHALVFATNGAEAVEKVQQDVFDLVLMDVQMPVMDGVEATRRIRRLQGPARGVPIVGLTANVMARDRDAYLEAGMDGCLGKPIDWDELSAAIGRHGEPPRPATVAEPAGVLVDVQVLADLGRVVGDYEVKSLVRLGIAAYRDYCAGMGTAAGAADLRSGAHKLKGSAGTLGLLAISAAAVRIESAVAKGLEGAPLVRDLERTIEATRLELVRLGIIQKNDGSPASPTLAT